MTSKLMWIFIEVFASIGGLLLIGWESIPTALGVLLLIFGNNLMRLRTVLADIYTEISKLKYRDEQQP